MLCCRFTLSSYPFCFFFSSRRRHTRSYGDWSSDVCSSDLPRAGELVPPGVTSLASPLGVDLLVPSGEVGQTAADLVGRGARLAGMWAFEALRIAAHQPRLGLDTDHRTIPHEVGWIGSAVKLDKGCYRGQETVARVHNLGHPPRRMVMLHLDGSVDRLPAHGDPVELDGAAVGFVGSAARPYALRPIE